MTLMWIKDQPTFLSKDVENVLCTASREENIHCDAPRQWLKSTYEIEWKDLELKLEGISETYGSKGWFEEAIEVLVPLFNQCDNCLRNITTEDYEMNLHRYLKWTHQEDIIHTCVTLLSSKSDQADHLLSLLVITSLAERSLGNLLLTRQKQVPFLLRDLLVSAELQEILGKAKIQVLVTLFGSVLGLNLRNIAWHGFLSPKEARSSFAAVIVLILADCGRIITGIPELEENILKRPLTSFTEVDCSSIICKDGTTWCRTSIEELIIKSPLVPNIMMPAWIKVLDLLENREFGLCVSLLLPLMECSMRCLFAHVNRASERVLTADNSTYYTTFDEILHLNIEKKMVDTSATKEGNPDTENTDFDEVQENSVNLVPFYIGRHVNEALHDMFNFVHGPRVRDRFSHGEVQLDSVSKCTSYHLMYINLILTSLGNWQSEHDIHLEQLYLLQSSSQTAAFEEWTGDKSRENVKKTGNAEVHTCSSFLDCIRVPDLSSKTVSLINILKNEMSVYKCKYHPSALLVKYMNSCLFKLEHWTTWERVSEKEIDYPNWDSVEFVKLPETLSYALVRPIQKVFSIHDIRLFQKYILDAHMDVLYRCKSELEIVSLLCRILHNVELCLEGIKDSLALKYSQYQNKILRSRQRVTYCRQLTAVPSIILSHYFTCQCVHYISNSLNSIIQNEKSDLTSLSKILKKVLKHLENIASKSNININRWEEAHATSVDNINDLIMVFGK